MKNLKNIKTIKGLNRRVKLLEKKKDKALADIEKLDKKLLRTREKAKDL